MMAGKRPSEKATHKMRSLSHTSNPIDYLCSQGNLFHVVLTIASVLAIVAIQSSVVHELSLGMLYLIPLALAAGFLSGRIRITAFLFTVSVWLIVEILAFQAHPDPVSAFWNTAERALIFGLVATLVVRLRTAYSYEKNLARTDYLTGVANSRSFFELAQNEISRANRYGHPLTLAYLDVDDFKGVNDKHGHAAGDKLLKSVCEAITRNVRQTDVLARLGGDEFAILLPETDERAADVVINKMRKALMEEMLEGGWNVTFSIGVVTCVDSPPSVAEVVKWGDDLVYRAKRSGKNTAIYDVVFTEKHKNVGDRQRRSSFI